LIIFIKENISKVTKHEVPSNGRCLQKKKFPGQKGGPWPPRPTPKSAPGNDIVMRNLMLVTVLGFKGLTQWPYHWNQVGFACTTGKKANGSSKRIVRHGEEECNTNKNRNCIQ